jgi:hypothetical protein
MDIYKSTFLVAISQLPLNVASAYTVDIIGRRKTLARMCMCMCNAGRGQ